MTVLSTKECVEHLKYNASELGFACGKIETGLPLGLTGHGLFCTEGESEITAKGIVYKSSCMGDSGGPLKTLDPNNENRDTLIGLVSGGVTCGTQLIPTWQTRVSYHTTWINFLVKMNRQMKMIFLIKETKEN